MIKDVFILPVLNSRGEKTIKITVKTESGKYFGYAPSGKSRGKYEAKTKRVETILRMFPKIRKYFLNQEEKNADHILEKLGINKIGANLSIAISIACYRALADNKVYKYLNPRARNFPFPVGNVIGGGAHGGYTSIQEFLVIPVKAKTISKAVETNFRIWKQVGERLRKRNLCLGKNDENAWISNLNDLDTLDFLIDIAKDNNAKLGLDFAASQFYKNKKYVYSELNKNFDSVEQLDFVKNLIKTYDLIYVEDPFHENDFLNFKKLTKSKLIVGDDLFATNSKRLEKGIKMKAGNGIIIKPDQSGTVSRTLNVIKTAIQNNSFSQVW
jgi:enolase